MDAIAVKKYGSEAKTDTYLPGVTWVRMLMDDDDDDAAAVCRGRCRCSGIPALIANGTGQENDQTGMDIMGGGSGITGVMLFLFIFGGGGGGC